MDEDLTKKILQANIALHETEAEFYDVFHAELNCRAEKKLINKVIADAMGSLQGSKLHALDIGAGTGNITLKLGGYDKIELITALDISSRMLAELNRKIPGSGSKAKIVTVESEVNAFFSGCNQDYDLITVSSVLHHIPDYMQTLESIVDHLKPGGLLLIFIEPTGEKSKILNVLGWWDMRLFVRLFLQRKVFIASRKFDYTLSDYHVYHGFELKKIRIFFTEKKGVSIISLIRYNLFKLPFFRFIGKGIKKKNNFIMMVKKERGN